MRKHIFKIKVGNPVESKKCQKYFMEKFGVTWMEQQKIQYVDAPFLFIDNQLLFSHSSLASTYKSIEAIPLPASYFTTLQLSKKDKIKIAEKLYLLPK